MNTESKINKLFVDYTEIKDVREQGPIITSGKGFTQTHLYNFDNYSKGGDETPYTY